MFSAGLVGGAVWILIPTLARAYANVNELITTLLLNFVAILLVYYVSTGPWRDRTANSATARLSAEIPEFWGTVHWGLPVAIVVALAVAGLLAFSRWGYEVRLAGSNPSAAHYAGIPARRHLVTVMLLSGAIAGLAGMLELAGTVHRLQGGISNNYGYLGIMVAVLARTAIMSSSPREHFQLRSSADTGQPLAVGNHRFILFLPRSATSSSLSHRRERLEGENHGPCDGLTTALAGGAGARGLGRCLKQSRRQLSASGRLAMGAPAMRFASVLPDAVPARETVGAPFSVLFAFATILRINRCGRAAKRDENCIASTMAIRRLPPTTFGIEIPCQRHSILGSIFRTSST